MILLCCDEAYALDYFSILRIKSDNGLPVRDELERLEQFLRCQMPNLDKVLLSQEFFLLLKANQATFDAIELAHKDKISASKVQKVNRKRYEAKRALQERFWPNSKLMEAKT